MRAVETLGVGRVSEPLDQVLGDEFANGLSSVAFVIKVVECDAEESVAFRSALRVGTSEEVGVAFEYCAAVGASVIFERVVAIDFISCG